MTTYSIDGSPIPAGTQAINIKMIERRGTLDGLPYYDVIIRWVRVAFRAQIGIDKAGQCRVKVPYLQWLDGYAYKTIDPSNGHILETPAIMIDAQDQETLITAASVWYWQQEQAITASRMNVIQRNLNVIEGAR